MPGIKTKAKPKSVSTEKSWQELYGKDIKSAKKAGDKAEQDYINTAPRVKDDGSYIPQAEVNKKYKAWRDTDNQRSYADGVKGIVVKPKITIAADATATKKPTNLKAVSDAHATKVSKMDNRELMDDAVSNSIKGNISRKEQDIDSLANRNTKNRGGYKNGTKGIKIKGKDLKAK